MSADTIVGMVSVEVVGLAWPLMMSLSLDEMTVSGPVVEEPGA